ncbi:MAG: DNA polymerase I, partial [Proteobacteria bacterium]|nr:DNA polymerase I [Pseudomonadota bacterium]
MSQKLYLIDGSGFIFRAYHALPPLRRQDGLPVGAVYGFCNMLLKLLANSQQPDYLAVIFDAARITFRQSIYPNYKANRPELPEDLIPQFPLIRQACNAFNIPTLELEGYEADDLIASYTKEAKEKGLEVVIVSSDKDLMQLVNDKVCLLDPLKNKILKTAEVLEKFGVPPQQVIDVQALAGDSTDNVPGVPGIGIKTASELIRSYGSLENLLEKASDIKQPKRRQILLDYKKDALISKQLVTLKQDIPLPLPLTQLSVQRAEKIPVLDFLRRQDFISLINRVEKELFTSSLSEISTNYKTILTFEELEALLKKAQEKGLLSFDCETTSLHIQNAELVGISLSVEENTGFYIPLAHQDSTIQQLPLTKTLDLLKPILCDPSILKIGHNLKYDMGVMRKYGLSITPYTDTCLMSYVLDSSKHGHSLDELSERHLSHQTVKYHDVTGSGRNQKSFKEVEIDKATHYSAEDADMSLRLYHLFSQRLIKEKLVYVYERIERPLVSVITEMEAYGVLINKEKLEEVGRDFTHRLLELEKTIYKKAGRPFTIGSPKQLGEVLFEEQKLPTPKKSKTGLYVTDADVLENLASLGFDLPKYVLEWRGLSKLRSTYVEGLIKAIHPKTGRVHTNYSLAGTSTGRLASSEPNLQNIPVRTSDGRKIRQAFIAPKGFVLMSFDYSQIELRLLAHMAQIPSLIDSFQKGQDIHSVTASQIFGMPSKDITPDLRRKAKAINFGIIYGISAYGLSQQLGISQQEAGAYIKAYLERYPGISDYMEKCKTQARQQGYVTTLFGRRCYTLSIQDKNPTVRQFSERQAINAPLQGSNADIIKQAMHRIS